MGLSTQKKEKRWHVMKVIIEAQKALTGDNLALLYTKLTRREREDGKRRATFRLNAMDNNNNNDKLLLEDATSVHRTEQELSKRTIDESLLFKSSNPSKKLRLTAATA